MGYGFYNDEVTLPHKPLPLAVHLVIEDALRLSWQRLKDKSIPNFQISEAKEDQITLQLYKVVFNEVFNKGHVDGFDEEHFSIGAREAKLPNYDGSKPDLMPDLLFAIRGRVNVWERTQDWLFVECKPVDRAHGVGVHYFSKGIARFILGDYAWAMTSAMMVGYCAQGYEWKLQLKKALRKKKQDDFIFSEPNACEKSPNNSANSQQTCISTHDRNFCYLETGIKAPVIELRHLWLII